MLHSLSSAPPPTPPDRRRSHTASLRGDSACACQHESLSAHCFSTCAMHHAGSHPNPTQKYRMASGLKKNRSETDRNYFGHFTTANWYSPLKKKILVQDSASLEVSKPLDQGQPEPLKPAADCSASPEPDSERSLLGTVPVVNYAGPQTPDASSSPENRRCSSTRETGHSVTFVSAVSPTERVAACLHHGRTESPQDHNCNRRTWPALAHTAKPSTSSNNPPAYTSIGTRVGNCATESQLRTLVQAAAGTILLDIAIHQPKHRDSLSRSHCSSPTTGSGSQHHEAGPMVAIDTTGQTDENSTQQKLEVSILDRAQARARARRGRRYLTEMTFMLESTTVTALRITQMVVDMNQSVSQHLSTCRQWALDCNSLQTAARELSSRAESLYTTLSSLSRPKSEPVDCLAPLFLSCHAITSGRSVFMTQNTLQYLLVEILHLC